ncbi:MAG: hypothetical protein KIT72_09395 [Polyangiaceae bacterium]|nr:hypothetical protein [Polyangiaceae bacterium]MCW5790621.1 hypothetical protein [Polyangiaceae bacterium]
MVDAEAQQRAPGRERRGQGLLAILLVALPVAWTLGCKSKPAPVTDAGAPEGGVALPAAPRCVEPSRGAAFLIGQPSPEVDAGEQALDLPFAIEVGRAAPHGEGFVVTALRSVAGQTRAVLASVTADAAGGRLIELGRVHGDVDPPRLSARDGRLVVGVVDHDATSTIVRLASVSQLVAEPQITWGALPRIGNDESQAFDLGLGATRGVLVWDEFRKEDGHGTLWSLTFGLDDPGSVTPARLVSVKGADTEAPRLISRDGGYWLAYVAHARGERRQGGKPSPDIDLESLVELGERWVELMRLDESGVRVGEPLRVSRGGHALVFDLAPGPDGSAWIAWREDATSPGVERRAIWLASVDAAGQIQQRVIEDDRVGAGVPRLLPAASAGRAGWLALATVGDRTSFAALGADLSLGEPLLPDPLVGAGEILAARGDRLLIASPRGLSAELGARDCKPAAAAAPLAPSAEPGPPVEQREQEEPQLLPAAP